LAAAAHLGRSLTAVPPLFAPQLATNGPLPRRADLVVEPKFDGWRAQVAICPSIDGGIRITTRSGRRLARPIVDHDTLAGCGVRVVLDGELVAHDGSARSFYGVASALAATRAPAAVAFVAFDVLWLEGHDVTGLADRERRRLLTMLELPVVIPPRFDADDVDTVLGCCERLDLEGLVVKDTSAPYRPGKRTPAWRKVKTSHWRQAHLERRVPAERR